MHTSKEDAYRELVKDAKDSYASKELSLYWHPECEEINLWTYWQGRGCLDAKIMLVGQDWGSPTDDSAAATMQQVQQANKNLPYQYLENNPSITDKNLKYLFNVLGYDISEKQEDLFFTNFILGYRYKGFSGGYSQAWAKHDKDYMKRLINIVSPKVVLCLGRATFEGVLSSFACQLSPKIKGYNAFIESTRNPVPVELEDGTVTYVFALAHCGAMGTLNRNRRKVKSDQKSKTNADLSVQVTDWEKILSYL